MTTTIVVLEPKHIMELYGFNRDETYNLLSTKGCPVLPRKKHGPYKVIQEEFEKWMREQRA